MGIQVEDGKVRMGLKVRLHCADGHRMFPAQQSDDSGTGGSHGSQMSGHGLFHPPHHHFRPTHVGLQGRRGVDTDLGHIRVQFPVVIL